jgi:hypothetical protein
MRGGLKRIRLFKLIFLSSRLKKNTKSFDFVYGREQILSSCECDRGQLMNPLAPIVVFAF